MVYHVSVLVTCVLALMLNEGSEALSSEWLINVDDCGVTKGCYRIPDKCKSNSDCVYFLSWRNVSSNEVLFEFAAMFGNHSTPPWAGFGIAEAAAMPAATVVDCIVNGSNIVTLQMSYNVEVHHKNHALKNKYLGLVRSSLQGAVINSHIFCNFTRLRVVTTPDPEGGKVKNLTSPYHILFASGPTNASGTKEMHDFNDVDPYVSHMKIDFGIYSDCGDFFLKDPYIRAHATLMIFAWIVLASLGMFTSRYMKNQWNENGTICGKPFWFQIHRYSMVLVIALTLAGMLVIFAYNDWRFIAPNVEISVTTIHPTLGITIGALLLVNLLAGLLRPNIYSPYRVYFWFFHAFFGHVGHLLAAVTMYFGVMQYKAYMPEWTRWVVVGFAFWRILADVVMTFTRIRYEEQPSNYVALANNEVDESTTKVAAYRCAVMIVYSIGVVLLALTLIVAANVQM